MTIRRIIRAIAFDIYTLRDPVGAAIADGALIEPGGRTVDVPPQASAVKPGSMSAFGEPVPGAPGQQAVSLPARSLLLAGAVLLGGPLGAALYELTRAVA